MFISNLLLYTKRAKHPMSLVILFSVLVANVVASLDTNVEKVPLAVRVAEVFHNGFCFQQFAPVESVQAVAMPTWVKSGTTWNHLGFQTDCTKGENTVAMAPGDTSNLTMAKYYMLTYTSGYQVMDYTGFQDNEERVALLEYYWTTGHNLFEDATTALIGRKSC